MTSERTRVVVVWWITCAIWSTVWLAIKVGLRDLPPLSFAGWRLVIALVLLAPLLIAKRQILLRSRREWLIILGTGVLLLGVNYALVFWGAQFIPSGLTAVLQTTTPAFGMVVSYVLARERVSAARLLALAIGIGGLVIIFYDRLHVTGRAGFLGALSVTMGALFVAIAYVLAKIHTRDVPPIVMTSGQMLAGCVPLVAAGLLLDGNPLRFHWTPIAVAALLYLAIAGSIAGFWLNYWLLKRTSAADVLAISVAEPLFAVVLGAVVLHEEISWRVAIGGAFVLLGAVLLIRPERTVGLVDETS